MTNPMKWFFGGVLFVVLDNIFSVQGVVRDPQGNFGAVVLICCIVAAIGSVMIEGEREAAKKGKRSDD